MVKISPTCPSEHPDNYKIAERDYVYCDRPAGHPVNASSQHSGKLPTGPDKGTRVYWR